jgi:hypothetical protein
MASITYRELMAMTPEERGAFYERMNADLRSGRRDPASEAMVTARIRAFEESYGMSTDEMMKRSAAGLFPDNDDYADWMFWVNVSRRSRVVS